MVQPAAVQIKAGRVLIEGDLVIPAKATGLVVFAHGSGSSRFSRRNQSVAQVLQGGGFATLLLDLLTHEEESIDARTREYRFDVDRLGHRVVAALDWASSHPGAARLPIACFGASTGAAAALIAAAEKPEMVRAVISRGGRPDLAGYALPKVHAPTLLIVGGADEHVIELNRAAMRRMRAPVQLEIVPGATHLFEEPGALPLVSQLALAWCLKYLHGFSGGRSNQFAAHDVYPAAPVHSPRKEDARCVHVVFGASLSLPSPSCLSPSRPAHRRPRWRTSASTTSGVWIAPIFADRNRRAATTRSLRRWASERSST
jgi:dienelactone hydrolase